RTSCHSPVRVLRTNDGFVDLLCIATPTIILHDSYGFLRRLRFEPVNVDVTPTSTWGRPAFVHLHPREPELLPGRVHEDVTTTHVRMSIANHEPRVLDATREEELERVGGRDGAGTAQVVVDGERPGLEAILPPREAMCLDGAPTNRVTALPWGQHG